MVLVEGGKSEAGLSKVEVLRKGVSGSIQTPPQDLVALVADYPAASGLPLFHPDKVAEIADWLVKHLQGAGEETDRKRPEAPQHAGESHRRNPGQDQENPGSA
jgi:hypothetical protein